MALMIHLYLLPNDLNTWCLTGLHCACLHATLQVAAAREPESIAAEILGLMQYKGQLKGELASGLHSSGNRGLDAGLYQFCM